MPHPQDVAVPSLPERVPLSDKKLAHQLVKGAIDRREMVRPETCARCGNNPGRGKDGRALIQGHHHDYSKPLDVEWVCAKCHRKETPLPATMGAPCFGEKNGRAKLTAEDVHSVRRLRATGMKYIDIARMFSVGETTIRDAARGLQWAHINSDPTGASQ